MFNVVADGFPMLYVVSNVCVNYVASDRSSVVGLLGSVWDT